MVATVMRTIGTPCFVLGLILGFAPSLWAQDDTTDDTEESSTSSEDSATDETESTTDATEEDVQASPDVQSQIGIGTEKEEETDTEYDPTSPFAKAESQRRKKTYGHGFQFGARGGMVFPYKIQFGFDDSPPCDPDGDGESSATCGFVAPPQVEIALSFAPLDSVEPFVWARLGLGEESETSTQAAKLFGAGIRIYTMSESKFKLYFEADAGVALEGAVNANDEDDYRYGTDFFAHLGFGPQFDFNKYIGLYASIGPGVSFTRSITMQLEGNVGLQLRVP